MSTLQSSASLLSGAENRWKVEARNHLSVYASNYKLAPCKLLLFKTVSSMTARHGIILRLCGYRNWNQPFENPSGVRQNTLQVEGRPLALSSLAQRHTDLFNHIYMILEAFTCPCVQHQVYGSLCSSWTYLNSKPCQIRNNLSGLRSIEKRFQKRSRHGVLGT